MVLYVSDDWEKLVDDDGSVICENHKLDAQDILSAFGFEFEIREVEEDD